MCQFADVLHSRSEPKLQKGLVLQLRRRCAVSCSRRRDTRLEDCIRRRPEKDVWDLNGYCLCVWSCSYLHICKLQPLMSLIVAIWSSLTLDVAVARACQPAERRERLCLVQQHLGLGLRVLWNDQLLHQHGNTLPTKIQERAVQMGR